MGNLSAEQILRGVRTIGEAFEETGADVDKEAGIEVAREVLR
jgi:aspartate aminotransferase-like enzyme